MRYVWSTSHKFIIMLVAVSLLTSIFNIINLYILRLITMSLTSDKTYYFLMILMAMVVVSILIAVINGSINYLIEPILQNKVIEHIQTDIYKKAQDFNLERYENKSFYDLYYFVVEHGKDGIINIVTLVSGLLTNIVSVWGLGSIVFQYDINAITVTFIGVFISCILTMKLRRIQFEMKVDAVPDNREIEYIHRIFYLPDFIKEILVFNRENLFWRKYSTAWKKLNRKVKDWGKKSRGQYILISLVDICTEIAVLAYLGLKTINGSLQLAEFIVLYTGIQQMMLQCKSAISCMPEIYSNALELNKYFEFMELEGDNEGNIKIGKIEKIQLEKVSFSYDKRKKVLQNIDISLGGDTRKIAIVGQNGSGKSSLIKLLLGLYDQYEGQILINGKKLKNIDKDAYRKKIAVLFQDFKIFSATFDQNITMEYEPSQGIEKYLNELDISDWVRSLPQQGDTVLSREFDKNGITLSGGEQQKVGIARTLYKRSDVIVLDEPFSELDNVIANNLLDKIINRSAEKLMILVTHNLTQALHMDYIYVLSGGNLVEHGTRDELMRKRGAFFQLLKAGEEESNAGKDF